MPSAPDHTPATPDFKRLAVLPLRDVVVFPYVAMPLLVGRQASLGAIEAAAAEGGMLFLVTQRSADTEEPAAGDLHRVGTVARIVQATRQANGTARVLVEGLSRGRVSRYIPGAGILRASIADEPEQEIEDPEALQILVRRVLALFEEYVSLHRRIPNEVVALVQGADSIVRQAYGIAAHLAVRVEVRQTLLEAPTITALFDALSQVLGSETELLRLERKLDEEVRGSLFQNQREFYLQEQLKAIHRELGNDETDDVLELERQVEARKLPDAVKTRVLREVRKLRRMSPLSPESTVARNFVDWIVALPWTERTDDILDVAHARRILDEDHYGL